MKQNTLKLRRADPADSLDIWNWRNDSHTRAMSKTSDLITWHRHCKWLADALDNKNSMLYIGELDPAPAKVGIVRFDLLENNFFAEVSINLNPQLRSQGFGKSLLSLAIQEFFKYCSKDLIAEVKAENIPSIKMFTKLGFQETGTEGEIKSFLKPYNPVSKSTPNNIDAN